MKKTKTLIIGANSTIAKAIAKQIVDQNEALVVVTRNSDFYQQDSFKDTTVIFLENYQESEIAHTMKAISQQGEVIISRVFICHGVLHNARFQPEKRLEDFSPVAFNEVLHVNTVIPMLWLKHLVPILTSKNPCKIVVFSARVGSIHENSLGGWYSYRTSKAALNMLLKTTAVELARRAKNIKLISFHPGTTDSPLSKPFQKNVPATKLFTPEFVANKLIAMIEKMEIDGQASYLDWQGSSIKW
ncbi:MAG: SDR family NAD(P)-dependent oxidoreductase [Litorilituus sp.]|jgi:NAD(P)-dependent dehydrogenase (short-subunit alcohol dehydrogenase family)|nr:SDR family NAD(P)-dependent oxidoreductase [Litorilituus sp.]